MSCGRYWDKPCRHIGTYLRAPSLHETVHWLCTEMRSGMRAGDTEHRPLVLLSLSYMPCENSQNKWATWWDSMLQYGLPNEQLIALKIEIWGVTYCVLELKIIFNMNLHLYEDTFTNNAMEINPFWLLPQCQHKKQELSRNPRWCQRDSWEGTQSKLQGTLSLGPGSSRGSEGCPGSPADSMPLGHPFLWEGPFYCTHMMRPFFIRKDVRVICVVKFTSQCW